MDNEYSLCYTEVELEIKKEDDGLFSSKSSTESAARLNNSKLEIEKHFDILNNTLDELEAGINDPIEPKNEDYNITIKTEYIEPVSNNNCHFMANSLPLRSRNSVYDCPICRKSFPSTGKRKKHFKFHFYLPSKMKRKKNYFGRCLFICIFCGKFCIRKDEISIHCLLYKTKITSNNLRSWIGGREIISQLQTIKDEIDINYDNFAIKEEPEEIIPSELQKCEICLEEFESEMSLNEHSACHRSHTCSTCLKMFSSSYSLKRHQLTHSSLKLFKCNFCSKRFKTKENLKVHESINCKEKFVKWNQSQRRYFSETLPDHSCNQKAFDCTVCGKNAENKSRLDTHTEERHYKCELCPKEFKYPQDLKRHGLYHTGEKPFECGICQKRFRIKQHLTRHKFSHDDVKPFKCEICFKMFTQKSALVYHFRRHTNVTPFKCTICSKEFTEKKMLDYHILSHTGDKPFQCTTCSKRFKQKQDLNRHLHIHTGNKSVTCEICGKHFTRQQHLNDHLRTHTGEKPYQCYVCQKRFLARQNFIVHLRTHTKEVPGGCAI